MKYNGDNIIRWTLTERKSVLNHLNFLIFLQIHSEYQISVSAMKEGKKKTSKTKTASSTTKTLKTEKEKSPENASQPTTVEKKEETAEESADQTTTTKTSNEVPILQNL